MNVLIDVIDPRHRNEVMMLAVRRTLLGKFDFVGTFEMIDLADGFLVRRNDIHVFPDLRGIRHCGSPENGDYCKTPGRSKSCDVLCAGGQRHFGRALRKDQSSAPPRQRQPLPF
jgi:hypothetical protein